MKNTDQTLTKKDLWKVFRGQIFMRSCLNFARFQNLGFMDAMAPIIEKYYETPEEKKAIIDRHMQLFLTQPMVSAIPVGVSAALEERIATKNDIDPNMVNSVKTALMGPLAALGDSLINGTARPILAGIACGLALNGNPLGPILFLIGMSLITLGVRYFGVFKGYAEGVSIVANLKKSGLIDKITELASVAAFVIVGGFVPNVVSLTTPLQYVSGDGNTTIAIQATLDGLLPKLLPVLLTLLMYSILRKYKISPVLLMLILLFGGLIGYLLGIFG